MDQSISQYSIISKIQDRNWTRRFTSVCFDFMAHNIMVLKRVKDVNSRHRTWHTDFMKSLANGLLMKKPTINHDLPNVQRPNCYHAARKYCRIGNHESKHTGRTFTTCVYCSQPCCKEHSSIICEKCYFSVNEKMITYEFTIWDFRTLYSRFTCICVLLANSVFQ